MTMETKIKVSLVSIKGENVYRLNKVISDEKEIVIPEPIGKISSKAFESCGQIEVLRFESTTTRLHTLFDRIYTRLEELRKLSVRFINYADKIVIQIDVIALLMPKLESIEIETVEGSRITVGGCSIFRHDPIRIESKQVTDLLISHSLEHRKMYEIIDVNLPRLDFNSLLNYNSSMLFLLYLLRRMAEHPDLYPEEMHQTCLEWTKDGKVLNSLIRRCIQYNENNVLLWLAMHYKVPADIYDMLLEWLEKKDMVVEKAVVLQKKREYYDIEKLAAEKEEAEEKAFLDPYNTKAMQKIWRWKLLEDGTIELTGYRLWEPVMQVPAFIGKRRVSMLGSNMLKDLRYINGERVRQRDIIEEINIPFGIGFPAGFFCMMPKLKVVRCETGNYKNLPSKNRRLGELAFRLCRSLQEVEMPQITHVGRRAFLGCENLHTTIPLEQLKLIDSDAYANTGIKGKLNIPARLELYDGVFARTQISSVEIEDGRQWIPPRLFEHCNSLTDVSLASSVERIGYSAFFVCGIRTIEIRDFSQSKLTVLGDSAFACTKLEKVILPDSVREIEEECFWKCSLLTEVVLGNGISEIPDRCFYDCTQLVKIKFPANLQKIGAYAFQRTSFSELVIPESVRFIGQFAFGGCKSLQRVHISRDCVAENAFPKHVEVIRE